MSLWGKSSIFACVVFLYFLIVFAEAQASSPLYVINSRPSPGSQQGIEVQLHRFGSSAAVIFSKLLGVGNKIDDFGEDLKSARWKQWAIIEPEKGSSSHPAFFLLNDQQQLLLFFRDPNGGRALAKHVHGRFSAVLPLDSRSVMAIDDQNKVVVIDKYGASTNLWRTTNPFKVELFQKIIAGKKILSNGKKFVFLTSDYLLISELQNSYNGPNPGMTFRSVRLTSRRIQNTRNPGAEIEVHRALAFVTNEKTAWVLVEGQPLGSRAPLYMINIDIQGSGSVLGGFDPFPYQQKAPVFRSEALAVYKDASAEAQLLRVGPQGSLFFFNYQEGDLVSANLNRTTVLEPGRLSRSHLGLQDFMVDWPSSVVSGQEHEVQEAPTRKEIPSFIQKPITAEDWLSYFSHEVEENALDPAIYKPGKSLLVGELETFINRSTTARYSITRYLKQYLESQGLRVQMDYVKRMKEADTMTSITLTKLAQELVEAMARAKSSSSCSGQLKN